MVRSVAIQNLIGSGLALVLLQSACNKIDFQAINDEFSIDDIYGETPDPDMDRLLDKTVQTQMNTPIDFAMILESGADPQSSNLFPTFDRLRYSPVRIGDFGRLEIIDPVRFLFRYTPATDYRGSVQHQVFLVNEQNGYSTSTITTQVVTAFNSLQPALAIRGFGCISCHAQVHSNIVTDFGKGSSFFLGQPAFGTSNISFSSGSIYGDHDGSLATMSLFGKDVIVPNATIPAQTPGLGNPAPRSLANYVADKIAGKNPNSQVVSRQNVFIGAPTADRIREVSGFARHGRSVNYIPDNFGDGANIAEAFVFDGVKRALVNKTGTTLRCDGDLVVQGSVKLVNLSVETVKGCRIYSTESVFIQGPIAYSGPSSDANLQIVAARSIIMGLGQNSCNNPNNGNTLETRLNIWTWHSHFTRGNQTPAQTRTAILDDYNRVGGIREANCEPGGRVIPFSRLLLNAPQVHGRYHGDFSGSIIAELSIVSLNNFRFFFDPVFSRVPVLPLLLSSDFLTISDN
jgi:hypothetical protein